MLMAFGDDFFDSIVEHFEKIDALALPSVPVERSPELEILAQAMDKMSITQTLVSDLLFR